MRRGDFFDGSPFVLDERPERLELFVGMHGGCARPGEPNSTFARLLRPADATVTARNTRAHRRRLSRAMSLLIEALRYRG
jgi:hypothetical protein